MIAEDLTHEYPKPYEQAAKGVPGLLLTPPTDVAAAAAAAATTATASDDGRWRRVRVHLIGRVTHFMGQTLKLISTSQKFDII